MSISLKQIVHEIHSSLKLALPLVVSELIFGCSGFLSTMMVARLGREALAANALVWSTFITLILFFIGVLSATGVLVAQSYGAKSNHGVQTATKQGLILGAIFSIPMVIILYVAPYCLILTGQNAEIIKIATPYFHSLALVMLPINFLVVMEQFLIGISKTRLVLIISIMSVPLQLIIIYLLLFGKFGFPQVGLPGIGYGIALSHVIAAFVVGLYVHRSKHSYHYHVFANNWHINKKFILEIIRVGMPIGGIFAVELAFFASLVVMMGKLGTDVLAAHQIAIQALNFAITIIFGLAQATGMRVGHEVGRNNRSGLLLVAKVNIGIGLCAMILFSSIYTFFPHQIIAFDLNVHAAKYQSLVQLATSFLAIAAIAQLIDSVRLNCSAALRGLKDTKIPFFISIFCFWIIAFPCSYVLGFVMHLGGVGIWWGSIIGLFVSALILLLRFQYLAKRLDLKALVLNV